MITCKSDIELSSALDALIDKNRIINIKTPFNFMVNNLWVKIKKGLGKRYLNDSNPVCNVASVIH